MAEIDGILDAMERLAATDLHLRSGLRPRVRIADELQELTDQPPVAAVDLGRMTKEIFTAEQRDYLVLHDELDFTYSTATARFRGACFRDHRGPGVVFRRVPRQVARLAELGLPEGIGQFAHLRHGLVLVTGTAESGKSSTLAAILQRVNELYHRHVITLEDPIEFVFEEQLGVFHQRRLHDDFATFESGIRDAMHQDPDVLMVGQLSDPAILRQALIAAESGILVFGTLDTVGSGDTIDRMVEAFPADEQPQVRVQLADCLAGIVSQALLRRADGNGRVPATEVLVASPAVAALIRDGRTKDVINVIQAGRSQGMYTLDDSLLGLLDAGIVTAAEAWSHARNKRLFERSSPAGIR